MGDGWGLEERREAADSVFLFPVVCWLSVMRPRLRPRRPVIGQGIRWLPREAGPGPGCLVRAKARKTDKSFQKQCRHKERKESCANLCPVWMVNCLNGHWNTISDQNRWKNKTNLSVLLQLTLLSETSTEYILIYAKQHWKQMQRSISVKLKLRYVGSYNVFLKMFFEVPTRDRLGHSVIQPQHHRG